MSALTFTGKQDGTLENNQNKGDFQDWFTIELWSLLRGMLIYGEIQLLLW